MNTHKQGQEHEKQNQVEDGAELGDGHKGKLSLPHSNLWIPKNP